MAIREGDVASLVDLFPDCHVDGVRQIFSAHYTTEEMESVS